MSNKVPPGYKRIFTYLPDGMHKDLQLLAVQHDHTLVEQFQEVILEYLEKHRQEIPRPPRTKS